MVIVTIFKLITDLCMTKVHTNYNFTSVSLFKFKGFMRLKFNRLHFLCLVVI